MRLRLPYGRDGLALEVPDGTPVLRGPTPEPLADPGAAVTAALRAPLHAPGLERLARRGDRVVVVFPDLTRPMPNRTVLPPLLAELDAAGVRRADVTLLCATGTHRSATPDEMVELVGEDIVADYEVADHRAEGDDHVEVGRVDGTAVLLDRRYVEADVRIVTGFVEPHFFAGFSGGPKAVCPGLAATTTILEAHAPSRIADPRATWMVTRGNPVHDFVRAASALCPPDLAVDVTIDDHRRLTGVWVGRLPVSHEAACAEVARSATVWVERPYDVVVSTNGGYPLDRNLYQSVKGMAAAERIVSPGGTIVMATECVDGLPSGSPFGRLLAGTREVAELIDPSAPRRVDRWQAQILGRVRAKARVLLYAEGLRGDEVVAAQLEAVDDVSSAVSEALTSAGPRARLAVLPDGPLTVAGVGAEGVAAAR